MEASELVAIQYGRRRGRNPMWWWMTVMILKTSEEFVVSTGEMCHNYWIVSNVGKALFDRVNEGY